MDKNASYKIVKDTLQSPFDKQRFLLLIKNFLNEINEEKSFQLSGAYITEIFRPYVKQYERLGTYTDPEGKKIDVLVVYLQKETSLERARTAQRNFVARYLKDRDQKDAGLVAFVSPNSEDWRFSLIKMEYKFEEGKSGRIKVKEEFTPARRWSFLVGANENSHTAQSRLAPILQDDEHNPTINDLEETFNIETVTKEFFEKYRDLFLRVKEILEDVIKKDAAIRKDFTEKGVDTIDFSKKLLGQIVFLYFLQKKGWFGVERDATWGSGPKNFLRQLFEKKHGNYKNFFNDILEPLFYEALARERDADFYSRFNCKIPFLNGGLFDPINNYDWVHTDILLPNDIFSNDRKTKEGDIGDGILDVFDRYNFTVKEDEPLEKEVAVDPEMLGKVFENLLEVKDRKSKGTYYTPREIVHYMCVQSLANYLTSELEGKVSQDDFEKLIKYGEMVGENEARVEAKGEETQTYYYKLPESIRENTELIDEKLANIKVCDPAIGSGAFPVGMMNEIVRTRNTLSNYIKDPNRTLYNLKRDCIQNSLYGVDIDPSAVEIAKLRLWLSLVVDEDDMRQIRPLPNLDYKIMQGNSLLEEFEGVKLFDDKIISAVNFDKEKQIESLKEKQNALSSEYIKLHQANELTNTRKEEIATELKRINNQIKGLNLPRKIINDDSGLFDVYSNAKKKADDLKRLHKEFFETTQKKKKDDIKRQIENLEWELIEATLKEEGKNSELKEVQGFKKANTRPFFLWKLHFADVFQENGGFDVVIANPPYVQIKQIPWDDRKIFEKIFRSAVGRFNLFYFFLEISNKIARHSGISTYIVPDRLLLNTQCDELRKWLLEEQTIIEIDSFAEGVFEYAVVDSIIILYRNEFSNKLAIKAKCRVTTETLGTLSPREIPVDYFLNSPNTQFDLSYDPKTSSLLDKIKSQSITLGEIAEVKDGIIQGKVADKLFLNQPLDGKSKPLLFGEDVTKFSIRFNNNWVNYSPSEMMRLEVKRRGHGVRHGLWMRTPEIFERNKILTRQTADEIIGVYDTKDYYYSNTLHGTTILNKNYHPLYVLALLNSKLMTWYYRSTTAEAGKVFAQVKIEILRLLPICRASEEKQKPLIKIVEDINSITKSKDYTNNGAKQAETQVYMKQLDEMIYKLYELTSKEIEIIKNA